MFRLYSNPRTEDYNEDTLLTYQESDSEDVKKEKARQWFEKIYYKKLLTTSEKDASPTKMVKSRRFNSNNDYVYPSSSLPLAEQHIIMYNNGWHDIEKLEGVYREYTIATLDQDIIDKFDKSITTNKAKLKEESKDDKIYIKDNEENFFILRIKYDKLQSEYNELYNKTIDYDYIHVLDKKNKELKQELNHKEEVFNKLVVVSKDLEKTNKGLTEATNHFMQENNKLKEDNKTSKDYIKELRKIIKDKNKECNDYNEAQFKHSQEFSKLWDKHEELKKERAIEKDVASEELKNAHFIINDLSKKKNKPKM